MSEHEKFLQERTERVAQYANNQTLQGSAKRFMDDTLAEKYSYNFSWMGRPIIQYPQDILAMQELIWEVKPDLIIETGVAHGGSLILYASLLELLGANGHILGIDIDIRRHNREAIEAHPMFKRISLLEGSSIAPDIMSQVKEIAGKHQRIMVVLDSNHSHEHVLEELKLYANLTSIGSYCVVFDTVVENMEPGSFPNRPWDKGNNPMTAVYEYLESCDDFVIDHSVTNKILLSVAPSGYLKRVK